MAVAIWFLAMAVLALAYRGSGSEPGEAVVTLAVIAGAWAATFDLITIFKP